MQTKGYDLKVAYVLGDNLFEEMKDVRRKGLPPHLDSDNSNISIAEHGLDLLEKDDKPIVSANAYLGAREIVKGLENGADIIIAGRVADASPVSDDLASSEAIVADCAGHRCCVVLALLGGYGLR